VASLVIARHLTVDLLSDLRERRFFRGEFIGAVGVQMLALSLAFGDGSSFWFGCAILGGGITVLCAATALTALNKLRFLRVSHQVAFGP
jgi:hypothetical protein